MAQIGTMRPAGVKLTKQDTVVYCEVDSSLISEEIRDEVDLNGSIIDEVGMTSVKQTFAKQGLHQSKAREISGNKFTNSMITEETQLGFSITGGHKNDAKKDQDLVIESSIQDEVSVAGFGGSRNLQGRIVTRKDLKGNKKEADMPAMRASVSITGEEENEEDTITEAQLVKQRRIFILNKTKKLKNDLKFGYKLSDLD